MKQLDDGACIAILFGTCLSHQHLDLLGILAPGPPLVAPLLTFPEHLLLIHSACSIPHGMLLISAAVRNGHAALLTRCDTPAACFWHSGLLCMDVKSFHLPGCVRAGCGDALVPPGPPGIPGLARRQTRARESPGPASSLLIRRFRGCSFSSLRHGAPVRWSQWVQRSLLLKPEGDVRSPRQPRHVGSPHDPGWREALFLPHDPPRNCARWSASVRSLLRPSIPKSDFLIP